MKRFLSLVLMIIMLGALSVSAVTDDEKEGLLSDLGIFEGYEDGEFRADALLSRAEAATVIVRLLNKEDEAVKGETIFSDVAASHWASGYIRLATEEGIVAGFGDGTFAPGQKVTYRQFIKLLCCALGYDIAAEARGGWANEGYLDIADIIGLTKGMEYEKDTPVTRGNAADLIYNALEIELMDEEVASAGKDGNVETDNDQKRTLLTVCFDYQLVVGELNTRDKLEVTRTYKNSQGYYAKGDIISFATSYDGIEELLGKTIMAYVKKIESGENVLLVARERAGLQF